MGTPSGLIDFQLTYAISPIVFTGGIASAIPGNALPLINISSALSFASSLVLAGSISPSLDDMITFQPAPGSTLIDNQIGMYPFANRVMAANAIIKQPLAISMLMFCPVGRAFGYATKPSVMQSIQQSFDNHNGSGGTYTVLTLSYAYTDCVMTAMTDISTSLSKQVQTVYKLDFVKPLISLSGATTAYNSLMNNIAGNTPTNGSNVGPGALVGQGSGQGGTFIPSVGQGSLTLGGGANYIPTVQSAIDTGGIP
jgi:hypothetical protein